MTRLQYIIYSIIFIGMTTLSSCKQETETEVNSIDFKVSQLISKMTLEEKIGEHAVPLLGIP